MVAPQLRVLRASPGLVWRAIDDGQAVGAVTAFLRPDDRWFVAFDTCRDDAYGALLAAVAANTGSDLYATVDEGDEHSVELLEIHGFTVARRESMLLIPTDPAITGLRAAAEPDGVVVVSAADAYQDELRRLDDALRQDVPGTAGWRWDPGDFHEETFDSQFDPATYLIAVDAASGAYMSLVRVWNSPGKPRLGLVATLARTAAAGLPGCCSRGRSVCSTSEAVPTSPPRLTIRIRPPARCCYRSGPSASAVRSSSSGGCGD